MFISILALYMTCMYFINDYFIRNCKPKYPTVNCLVMGDSYLQHAIDPDQFYSLRNYSQAAEPYFITYWKLQNFLENNDLDTLMLGFSYHNLSSVNDQKLHDPEWSFEMFRRIYPIEKFSTLKGMKVDWYEFNKIRLKYMCLFPIREHLNYVGEYSKQDKSNLAHVQKILDAHYKYKGEPAGFSFYSLQYLDSILVLCKEHQIKPIFIASPLHKKYKDGVPTQFVNRFNYLKADYSNRGVTVLDFSNAVYPGHDFLNPDHLNVNGARHFAIDLKKALREQ